MKVHITTCACLFQIKNKYKNERALFIIIIYTLTINCSIADTEDASEADIAHNDGPIEIKEQMYQDKLASLKKKLSQLKDGTHFELNQKIQLLREQYQDRIQMNKLNQDYLLECIEKEYVQEKKAAVKEFEEKKIDLKENLISDLEDKKRTIESERFSWELTGDPMEVKPVMTRKLRRRPNDPIPVPEKRRKIPTTQIVHLLDEKDIEHDLKIVSRGKLLAPTRKRSRYHFLLITNL